MKLFATVLVVFLLTCSFAPIALAEDDSHSMKGHKHLALFVGAGEEENARGGRHSAKAIGLEFEYHLSNKWGIGGVVEHLEVHGKKNTVVVLPVSYYVNDSLRAFAGPGYEFKAIESRDKALLRVGLGYSFHLGEKWTVAPEVINDFVSGGYNMWLVGVAVGYGF